MSNRNYFDKPLQGGGRDAYDYGHTNFGNHKDNNDGPWWLFMAAIILYFLWQFAR